MFENRFRKFGLQLPLSCMHPVGFLKMGLQNGFHLEKNRCMHQFFGCFFRFEHWTGLRLFLRLFELRMRVMLMLCLLDWFYVPCCCVTVVCCLVVAWWWSHGGGGSSISGGGGTFFGLSQPPLRLETQPPLRTLELQRKIIFLELSSSLFTIGYTYEFRFIYLPTKSKKQVWKREPEVSLNPEDLYYYVLV